MIPQGPTGCPSDRPFPDPVPVVNIYIMIRLRGRIVETYADWRRQRSEGSANLNSTHPS